MLLGIATTSNEGSEPQGAPSLLRVRYLRSRNVIEVLADLRSILGACDAHLKSLGPVKDAPASFLRESLAALALHCATRPADETVAWSVRQGGRGFAVSLAGTNSEGAVVGRLQAPASSPDSIDLFVSDVSDPIHAVVPRRSIVEIPSDCSAFAAVERFYRTSEQRAVRFLSPGEGRYVMLLSHAGCDESWLTQVTAATLPVELSPSHTERLEDRSVRWHCGCSRGKVMATLAPAARRDLNGLLGDEEEIQVECPRCSLAYHVTRADLEGLLGSGGE